MHIPIYRKNHAHFQLLWTTLRERQEAQVSQRGRAMLRMIEYFSKSLKVTQGHSKWHPWIERVHLLPWQRDSAWRHRRRLCIHRAAKCLQQWTVDVGTKPDRKETHLDVWVEVVGIPVFHVRTLVVRHRVGDPETCFCGWFSRLTSRGVLAGALYSSCGVAVGSVFMLSTTVTLATAVLCGRPSRLLLGTESASTAWLIDCCSICFEPNPSL